VSERLAAAVPVDAWTPDAARRWWERHQPFNRMQATMAGAVEDGAVTFIDRARSRPRLARGPLAVAQSRG
jgi:hypothetical protein